ncbi:MAG TPA: serine/threonine-protein kinase, partial [Candidatus Xenobia bacterium]
MPLSPNTVIEDRYVITRPLKTGGMGTIYAAVDRRLGETPCALKELLNREGEEDQALVLRKFEEEMRILATLNHPGIPRVHDYFMHDGTRYIVMDLVDGQNLEELLQDSLTNRGRPLLPTQVATYALQILEVLQYLHGHLPPIIHRDLKPANVILEKNTQRVKLVDFGLARALRATTGNLNQTAIASLGYAPVEQIQGRATVRSDIYALGASMFHLLTGSVPVPMDAGPVQDANVEIDDELARVVDKATSVDESERFQSATPMAEALLAWKEGRSTGLPRRRPGSRKTTGKLGHSTLKRLTSPPEPASGSGEASMPVPTLVTSRTGPIRRPPKVRWLLAVASVVLLG